MIELWGMASPNVTKISLMLMEMGLPYRFRYVNVFAEEQFAPEFLEANPNHKGPVLIDHDGPQGERVTLFESGAILIYLAEKTGQLLPPPGTIARYETHRPIAVSMRRSQAHHTQLAPRSNRPRA